MAKRLTPEEKAARLIEKIRRDERRYQARKQREEERQKKLRHKAWEKRERERIKKKKEKFALNERRQKKNVAYESELKQYINSTTLYVTDAPMAEKYRLYRFFFPYKMASPTGKLHPLSGFSEEVALSFISILLNAGKYYYGYDYSMMYSIFCKRRVSGREFIRLYNQGVNSYKKFFPGAPAELLYALYNICSPGSQAKGCGEYLMCLLISDVVKGKDGDICTKSNVNIEMKAFDGRLSCQKSSDVQAMDEEVEKRLSPFCHGRTMLDQGMIELYRIIKSNWGWSDKLNTGWTDRDIIKFFARCKIETYSKYLTLPEKNLFIQNMTENWDAFFFNGEFTKESVNRINGCHDAYVYPLLEGFTHLKVDSAQPSSIKNAKDFDVHFNIFNRDDFTTPGLILKMIESGQIKFYGFIKNNGRDKAVHVGI